MVDDGCLAVLAGLAILIILGGSTGVLVSGAHEHSVAMMALGGGTLALLGACIAGQFWREHREDCPRHRREVQKGARWP